MPKKKEPKKPARRKTPIAWVKARRAKKVALKLDSQGTVARKERRANRVIYKRAMQTNKTGGQKGRPTYFHPRFCGQVIGLGKEGKSPTQIAAYFSIARSTLGLWRKSYPDFKEAFEMAMIHAQAYWEERLSERVLSNSRGGGPAVTALTFMLARRFREDYKDMKEVTGAKGTPLIPMTEGLPTREKVKAYLDAVKGGGFDEEGDL